MPGDYSGQPLKRIGKRIQNQRMLKLLIPVLVLFLVWSCKKDKSGGNPPPSTPFNYTSLQVNGAFSGFKYKGVSNTPLIKISFTAPLDPLTANASITMAAKNGTVIPVNLLFEQKDSTVTVQPATPLNYLSGYTLNVISTLTSKSGGYLLMPFSVQLTTAIDSADKFQVNHLRGIADSGAETNLQIFLGFWPYRFRDGSRTKFVGRYCYLRWIRFRDDGYSYSHPAKFHN